MDRCVPTLLVCAGGQSSSLTPNVTPGDGFLSKGFLISPGMLFLHVPLSLGGLVSSATAACEGAQRPRLLFFGSKRHGLARLLPPTFVHVLPLLLRFGCGRTGGFVVPFASQQRVPDAQRLAGGFGRRLRLAACRTAWDRQHKMSFPIRPTPLSLSFTPRSAPHLIRVLYSLIFLLMRSWLVKTEF